MEFRSAGSIDEALAWLDELGDEAQVLAGGTDVMIQRMRHEIDPSVLLYIGGLVELEGYAPNGAATFGALTTHRALATDPRVAAAVPGLAEAAATVGGWQTQQVGTLGGNLCNASPAADTAAPLLVADAQVELTSSTGVRTLALDEFLVGRRSTARLPNELLTGISATPIGPGTGETYHKLGRRSAMEVAIVGLATRLTLAPNGTVAAARIAACSVGPRPYRATDVEQILDGSRLEAETVAEAGQALVESAAPIDDARASASYRLRVLPGLLARAVADCRERIERDSS
jgi:carbon-monoxide dehydrogenase medium subunit